MSIFCLKDEFYDIVFNLKINVETYDFDKGEYIDANNTLKIIWKYTFIFFNGFIILCCLYVLIFIIIPIIYFRVCQSFRKSPRLSEIKSESTIDLLKERFTSDA